jgi:hypothetical protein
MCLRRAPEKYIAGAALDRAGLDEIRALVMFCGACPLEYPDTGLQIIKSVNWCLEHNARDIIPKEKIQWCCVW